MTSILPRPGGTLYMGLDPVSSGTSSSQIRSAMCHAPCFVGDAFTECGETWRWPRHWPRDRIPRSAQALGAICRYKSHSNHLGLRVLILYSVFYRFRYYGIRRSRLSRMPLTLATGLTGKDRHAEQRIFRRRVDSTRLDYMKSTLYGDLSVSDIVI